MTSATHLSRSIWADPFPKVTVTREHVLDGSAYLWTLYQRLGRAPDPGFTAERSFNTAAATALSPEKTSAPACTYDIKLCTAPCIGKINQADYRQMIDDLGKFLEGRTDPILSRLKDQMMSSESGQMNYEKAAVLRDQITAIEKVVERQKIISDTVRWIRMSSRWHAATGILACRYSSFATGA